MSGYPEGTDITSITCRWTVFCHQSGSLGQRTGSPTSLTSILSTGHCVYRENVKETHNALIVPRIAVAC